MMENSVSKAQEVQGGSGRGRFEAGPYRGKNRKILIGLYRCKRLRNCGATPVTGKGRGTTARSLV